MKIVRRLLWCRAKRVQLVLAGLGFTLGLFVLFEALHVGRNVLDAIGGQKASSQFVIIHKKVNFVHTLGLSKTGFSADELDMLRQQPGICDVGTIVTTNFAVAGAAQLGTDGAYETELFCEAVDDRFLDIHPDAWHWEEEDTQIPAIMGRDFLVLYNFGFATAKGLPKLTEETIGLLKAYAVCSGDEAQLAYTTKIVGLSDRFSTILVPMSFMTWANEHIGGKATPPASRVILEIEPGQEDAVKAFLADQGYETNQERFTVTQLVGPLKLALWIAGVFGSILIVVSTLSMILMIQLLISQATSELKLLHQLGFEDASLARSYVTVFLPVIVIPFILAGVGMAVAGKWIQPILQQAGIQVAYSPQAQVVILFLGTFVAFIALVYSLIFKAIQRI